MYRLQTKLIAFTFLLIVSVPVFLSVKFILKEILIEQEVEEKMKSEVLQTVRIAKTAINWVKPGKEILLDNKLFDVKYFESTNDIVTLTGFFDNEETELMSELNKYAEGNDKENPFSELAFKFQFSPLYNSHAEMSCATTWHCVSNQYHSFVSTLPVAPSSSFTHPPKLQASFFI
jgi:hypothetical protein